ncbi:nuclease-related domain-containing protein [Cryobacterium tepidiphilum]|nr:nuclease-related domain-containing protein [Cryobacterium tepidiphilum]
MGDRAPGQAVIEELLRQQLGRKPRSTLARFFGASPLAAGSVSWYEGARGELIVGQILATLPDGWKAFHSLPIGTKGSDIDHMVVGPGGVFSINTKHHNKKAVWVAGSTLMVSGQKQGHIRNAEFEAKRVTKLLRQRMPQIPAVQPVLVLVNPKSLTIKTKPERVTVIRATRLRRWLTERTSVFSETKLREITTVMDDPATWPSTALPSFSDSSERFAELHHEVQRAQFRRRVWSFTCGLLLIAGAVLAGPPLLTALLGAYFRAVRFG